MKRNCQILRGFVRLALPCLLVLPLRASAQGETEPQNNYFYSADEVAASGVYHINPSGDVDIIRLVVDTAGTLTVNVTGIPNLNAFYIDVKIYAEDTTTLIGRNSASSGCWNCPSSTSVSVQLCVGTYYVHLKEDGGGSSSAGFTVAFAPNTADANECNNTIATATALVADTTFTASISGRNLTFADAQNTSGADVDWYLAHVPEPEVLVASLTGIPIANQFYLDVEILNLQGQLIARNPASDDCWNCPSTTSVAAVLDSGWYYIRVKDDNYQVNIGSFQMTVRLDTLDGNGFNNYFALATEVEVAAPFDCQIYGTNLITANSSNPQATDVDHYRFTIDEPSAVTVAAEGIPLVNGFYLQMEVYSVSDTVTAMATNPASSCWNCPSSVAFTADLPAGSYFLRVRDNTGQTAQGAFTITLNAVSTVGVVEEVSSRALRISPNPTNGPLDIRLPAFHEGGTLVLMDPASRKTQQQRFASGVSSLPLDLTDNLPGLYLLELCFADGSRSVERVVKN